MIPISFFNSKVHVNCCVMRWFVEKHLKLADLIGRIIVIIGQRTLRLNLAMKTINITNQCPLITTKKYLIAVYFFKQLCCSFVVIGRALVGAESRRNIPPSTNASQSLFKRWARNRNRIVFVFYFCWKKLVKVKSSNAKQSENGKPETQKKKKHC